ncbi:hypothetical protein EDB19DRAFT_1834188 [Suillus lakei]|nr:hypothetical protein EDB19DRAFT_1834188 [Suillus lakei]
MVQLSAIAGLMLNFEVITYQSISSSHNMSSSPAIRFNEPPVTEYNLMDVDESSESRVSLDDLYLGLDDDIEYDSVSSILLDVLAAIPGSSIALHVHYTLTDQSPPAPADHPVLPIHLDLYLGPDDDLIDCDEGPDSADADSDALAAPEVSMSSDETSTELHSEQLDLTNEDLHLMLQEFQPFGSFKHPGSSAINSRSTP